MPFAPVPWPSFAASTSPLRRLLWCSPRLILIFLDYGRPWGAIAYVFGAVLSALAGFIGMRIATAANARTTEAARTGGIKAALPLAFRGGAVMGFTVAGLGLLRPLDRLSGVR